MTVTVPNTFAELTRAVTEIERKFKIKFYPGIFHPKYKEKLKLIYANHTNFLGGIREEGHEIKDITLTYEEMVVKFPDGNGSYNYEAYGKWIDEQIMSGLTFYYAASNETFSLSTAYDQAKKLGKEFIILENLS